MHWTSTSETSSDSQKHAIKSVVRLNKNVMAFRVAGSDARQQHGVGFIVNKTRIKSVIGCTLVSNIIIAIRISVKPKNQQDYADIDTNVSI